jgi:hypothetical protein
VEKGNKKKNVLKNLSPGWETLLNLNGMQTVLFLVVFNQVATGSK